MRCWTWAFHATEQLTLIVTRVPNAFLTTLGGTGNVGKAVQAVSTRVSESIAPIRDALTKPIPVTPAVVADPAPKSAVKPVKEPASQPNTTVKPKVADFPDFPADVTGRAVRARSGRVPQS